MLREDFPWIYELGVDAYRASLDDNKAREKDAHRRFFVAMSQIRRGQFSEMMDLDKQTYMMMREMEHFFHEDDDNVCNIQPSEDNAESVGKC